MPQIPIIMPQLGESIAEAAIINFLVQPGDKVKIDQELIEVETNKATMTVTAPCSGRVEKFSVQLNESYAVGAVLGQIEATNEEALRLGLTNWVVPGAELADKTREIALGLAKGPTVAFRYMKENLNRAMGGDVDDCLDLEATHHVHCGQTADHREAATAFVEKREPVFTGR